MKESSESYQPTSDILVSKLKSQGFFDKIRKRCLENVESNSDYIFLKQEFVDNIVSNFIANKLPTGSKLELRDQLRRRFQDDASFQHSLLKMSDLLLATQASPESLAPSINQTTCDALNVDYQEWLTLSQKRQIPHSVVSDKPTSPIKQTENCSPLLPGPSSGLVKKQPLLPISAALQAPESSILDSGQQQFLPDEDDVEMEVDDAGDEMEVESADSNVDVNDSQPQDSSVCLSTNSFISEATSHKNISLAASTNINKCTLATSLVAIKTSSSVSQSTPGGAAEWTVPISSEQLDAVLDIETAGGYSPLRRRMSLTGHLAKHDSPPAHLPIRLNVERSPSSRSEKKHTISSLFRHKNRFQSSEGTNSRRHDNYNRSNSQRYDGDNQYYNKRQHGDHRGDRYWNSDRYIKDDVEQSSQNFERRNIISQNHVSSRCRSGHDRRHRNAFPTESRADSRDLSLGQLPSLPRRQRQASPHSTHTPDTNHLNLQRHRKPDTTRGLRRRDSPHSRDYDHHQQSQHHQHGREKHAHKNRSSMHRSPATQTSRLGPHHPHRRHASPFSHSSSPSSSSHRSNLSTPLTSSRPSGYPF